MTARTIRWLGLGLWMLSLFGCPVTDWSENYDYEGDQPFDLRALHQLLDAREAGLRTLLDSNDVRALDTLNNTNYLFVGDFPYYGETDQERLLDYVARGNNAFIAANYFPEDMAATLFSEDCFYGADSTEYEYVKDPLPRGYLDSVLAYRYPAGDTFRLVNVRFWEVNPVAHTLISESLLCDDIDYSVLGGIDTVGINFVRIGWGEGDFYLYTNPVYLTNWFVLDTLQYRYPAAVLDVVANGPILWDEASRRYRRTSTRDRTAERDYDGGRNLLNGNETLRYILEHRALAFAWYTVLVGALLYIIFRGKRRQRIIPLLARRENSSQRFIETISRLVYQKGNHAALAQRELASLRFYLNQRFGLQWMEGTPPPPDLQERLGLPAKVAERAIAQIRLVAAGRALEEGDLLRFYRFIEPLYRA